MTKTEWETAKAQVRYHATNGQSFSRKKDCIYYQVDLNREKQKEDNKLHLESKSEEYKQGYNAGKEDAETWL